MKYMLGAAAAVLASVVGSGALFAGTTTLTVLATDYVSATKIVSALDKNFASQKLKHTAATTHRYATVSSVPPDPYLTATDVPPDPYLKADVPPDPYLTAVPPDPYQPAACRGVAQSWNVAVYQNRSQASFDALLKSAATNKCSLQITRATGLNADGSADMISVTFAPQ